MSETTLISIRVPVATAKKLATLSTATKRSKSFLGAEAVEQYLAEQEWQIKHIKAGLKSADAGLLVDHSQVTEWMNSWGTQEEKDAPQCD